MLIIYQHKKIIISNILMILREYWLDLFPFYTKTSNSLASAKSIQLLRFCIFDMHAFDTRSRGSIMQLRDQLIEAAMLTDCKDLYAAILTIAHPTSYAQLMRLTNHPFTKEDALDKAFDIYPAGNHGLMDRRQGPIALQAWAGDPT
jgi:hypothetical protein